MSSVAKPQDLPPTGGFGSVVYEKVPHKTFFNGEMFRFLLVNFVKVYFLKKNYHSKALKLHFLKIILFFLFYF